MTEVPINVAVQYSHKFVITPDNTAGANERAGFMEAPDMNAKRIYLNLLFLLLLFH